MRWREGAAAHAGRRAVPRARARRPTGRIEARVWSDVDLLDSRFDEGDAVRVLGRVDRFRDRLQLEVRSLEPAEGRPGDLAPALRRDADELDGFLEFLAGEIAHPGLAGVVGRFVGDEDVRGGSVCRRRSEGHHSYAGGLLEHTVGVATICREIAQLHPRLRRPPARGGAAPRRRPDASSWTAGRCSRRPTRAGCSVTSTWACG